MTLLAMGPLAPAEIVLASPAVEPSVGEALGSASEPLDSKLLLRSPGALPSDVRNPSVARGLSLAFNSTDLEAVYAAKGFGTCQTASAGPSPFAKNFSNFGSECFKTRADRYYLNADVAMRKSSRTLVRPTYAWNSTKSSDLLGPAGTRLGSRAAGEAVASNPVLRNLVEGRVEVAFSLGEAWRNITADAVVPARPRYVLKVARAPRVEPNPVLVAALGDEAFGYGNAATEEFEVGDRSIVEEWETPAQASPRVEAVTFGQRMAKTMGVPYAPFGRFAMRFERRAGGAEGQDAIAWRFAEANEMAFVEMTNLVGKGVVAYGYRLPYHRHSLAVQYVLDRPGSTTTYGYKINDKNLGEAVFAEAFDSKTQRLTPRYSARFTREI
jgi:hypothetical protein